MCTIVTNLLASAFMLASPNSSRAAQPAPQDSSPYLQIFYESGGLRLEGYLYRPSGDGPFPIIIYNHGSREGAERSERPFVFIGRLLTAAGYAVLVPERRGYGKSDGKVFREEVGEDVGAKFISRLQAESDDVLAALDYLKTLPWVDASRIGIMGWSFGGIVSVFTASRGDHFFTVVDQAGGALTWSRSRELQSALPEAARRIHVPILCMAAENDATTASVKSVCEAARSRGSAAVLTIYPPFTPPEPVKNVAPGHLIFSAQGVSHWGSDVVAFLDKHRPGK
jgi:dienelactone hydrolase